MLLYGCVAIMLLGFHMIPSSIEVTHGCPLGPPFYAMAERPILVLIAEKCPGLNLKALYLDDSTKCVEEVALTLDIVDEHGPRVEMFKNRDKNIALVSNKMSLDEMVRIFGGNCLMRRLIER
jgi:hypothetical protein